MLCLRTGATRWRIFAQTPVWLYAFIAKVNCPMKPGKFRGETTLSNDTCDKVLSSPEVADYLSALCRSPQSHISSTLNFVNSTLNNTERYRKVRFYMIIGCTITRRKHYTTVGAYIHKQPSGHIYSCWTVASCCNNKYLRGSWPLKGLKPLRLHCACLRGGVKSSRRAGWDAPGGQATPCCCCGQVEVATNGGIGTARSSCVPKCDPGPECSFLTRQRLLGLAFVPWQFITVTLPCQTQLKLGVCSGQSLPKACL